MKRLVVALVLLAASAAAAPYPRENSISFTYAGSTAHDFNCGYHEDGEAFILELKLYAPLNETFGAEQIARPVTRVGGFVCRVTAGDGLQIVGWSAPVPANVWTDTDGNMFVVYDEPLPVGTPYDGSYTVLATCHLVAGATATFTPWPELRAPCYVWSNAFMYVEPSPLSQVPDRAAYWDADDPVAPWVGAVSSVDTDYEIEIHAAPVPAAAGMWGSLKALYR